MVGASWLVVWSGVPGFLKVSNTRFEPGSLTMSPGTQASADEAAAPMTDGAGAAHMHHAWRHNPVTAAGPTALATAVASTPTTVQAATPPKSSVTRTAAAAADPGGNTQLLLSASLRSSTSYASAQARPAHSAAPDVPTRPAARNRRRHPSQRCTVRCTWVGHRGYPAFPWGRFVLTGASRQTLNNRISGLKAMAAYHPFIAGQACEVPVGAVVLDDLDDRGPACEVWIPLAGGGPSSWTEL